jgi:hypothetical protein
VIFSPLFGFSAAFEGSYSNIKKDDQKRKSDDNGGRTSEGSNGSITKSHIDYLSRTYRWFDSSTHLYSTSTWSPLVGVKGYRQKANDKTFLFLAKQEARNRHDVFVSRNLNGVFLIGSHN